MDLKAWKKLAEQEVYRYRDNRAFVQGVLDGGGTGGERMKRCVRWTLAVEYALEYLERNDPMKARFFKMLFGLETPRSRSRERQTILSLSFELHQSADTLYKWKRDALYLVVLAAVQTGALQPYQRE